MDNIGVFGEKIICPFLGGIMEEKPGIISEKVFDTLEKVTRQLTYLFFSRKLDTAAEIS